MNTATAAAETGKTSSQTCEHVDEHGRAAEIVEMDAKHAAVGVDNPLGLHRQILG